MVFCNMFNGFLLGVCELDKLILQYLSAINLFLSLLKVVKRKDLGVVEQLDKILKERMKYYVLNSDWDRIFEEQVRGVGYWYFRHQLPDVCVDHRDDQLFGFEVKSKKIYTGLEDVV